MSARDRILAKLKAGAPSTAGDIPDVARWYATHRTQESSADKTKRFRHCIELAHAEVHPVGRSGWMQ
jgi:L-lactate dehydrogenase complex protein LldG